MRVQPWTQAIWEQLFGRWRDTHPQGIMESRFGQKRLQFPSKLFSSQHDIVVKGFFPPRGQLCFWIWPWYQDCLVTLTVAWCNPKQLASLNHREKESDILFSWFCAGNNLVSCLVDKICFGKEGRNSFQFTVWSFLPSAKSVLEWQVWSWVYYPKMWLFSTEWGGALGEKKIFFYNSGIYRVTYTLPFNRKFPKQFT